MPNGGHQNECGMSVKLCHNYVIDFHGALPGFLKDWPYQEGGGIFQKSAVLKPPGLCVKLHVSHLASTQTDVKPHPRFHVASPEIHTPRLPNLPRASVCCTLCTPLVCL